MATFLLRPRSELLQAAAADPTAYFSRSELDRAAAFRGHQRLIGLGGLAVSVATLTLIAVGPGRGVRALMQRAERRPIFGGAAVGAGISLAITISGLPLSIWGHERAVDAGLSTQALGAWLLDVARSASIGAVFAAVGGGVAVALVRRFPRRWFVPAAGAVASFAVLLVYLQPVVIDPLFNRFEPVPQGALRGDVLEFADRSGVEVGEVYRIDASRRTTGINAYVGGLGHTKRVVIYDNLIDDFPESQVRSVIAHELGHFKHRDLPRGLLWVLVVALPGTLLVQRVAEVIDRSGQLCGGRTPGPAAVPAIALSVAIVGFALSCAANPMSRAVEARADQYALELTGDPRAFVALDRSLATRNLSDPDPPRIYQAIFGTHPTAVERIGMGRAWARGERPGE